MSAMAVVEVDASLKAKAEQILAASGHTVAEAVHSLLQRTVDQRAVPTDLFAHDENFACQCFDPDYVLEPNAETIEAMEEARRGGLPTFNSVEELMADLLAKD